MEVSIKLKEEGEEAKDDERGRSPQANTRKKEKSRDMKDREKEDKAKEKEEKKDKEKEDKAREKEDKLKEKEEKKEREKGLELSKTRSKSRKEKDKGKEKRLKDEKKTKHRSEPKQLEDKTKHKKKGKKDTDGVTESANDNNPAECDDNESTKTMRTPKKRKSTTKFKIEIEKNDKEGTNRLAIKGNKVAQQTQQFKDISKKINEMETP